METVAGDDRLSELPDCLLTNNILSRLTSRQAVRTSLLSRRWRHLWCDVPCVDIDLSEFRASEEFDDDVVLTNHEKARLSVEESEAFEDVGERLLPPLDAPPPPLDTLRLRVSCSDFGSTGRKFTRRGLARRPVEFHLCCDNDVSVARSDDKFPVFPGPTLPQHLGTFACRLTTMRLAGLSLADDFADCLAADFPVLEDLLLEDCRYSFRRLASQSLRNLSIDRCSREHIYNDVLDIAAPRIASLHINVVPPLTAECEMPWLVAASLATPAGELGVLRSLRHATSLYLLEFSTTELLLGGGVDFPVFGNLRNLILDGCDVGAECQVLRRFLHNAPSLETLTLRYCEFSGGSRSRKRKTPSSSDDSDSDPGSPTAYECKNLKSIEIDFCDGYAIDELVEFCDGHALGELAQALFGISKEEARPMESSVQHGKRRVKFYYS